MPQIWDHANQILCLYETDEWSPPLLLADTIVPWASEWLLSYEIWLFTGE